MSIKKELEKLKAYNCPDRCVLSVYLNTNPGDPEMLNGAWKIQLKSSLKRIDEYLDVSKDEKELEAYSKVKKKVIDEINDHKNELRKGVVIFASANDDLWSVHYVQVPVKTNFYWEDHAVTEQLEYMYKAYPEAGIIMPSFGEVRILDTAMGDVKDEIVYQFDPNLQVWGETRRDPSGEHKIGSTKVDTIEDRIKENLARFYKSLGSTVEQLKKKRGWSELHIAGEAEMAKAFAESLRVEPASCIYKNLNNSKVQEIINQVFEK